MDTIMKKILWQQFGAAIDTLENAINACPEEVWGDHSKHHEYWYMVYHTLFWLDYYLSDTHDSFKPPEPFTMSEFDPSGLLPERVYTQAELMTYLEHGRKKCRATIEGMTDEWLSKRYDFGKASLSYGELLLYNMRHVQHHAAQLNMLLRQRINFGSRWVMTAKD